MRPEKSRRAVEQVALAYARRSAGSVTRVVCVELQGEYAFAVIDLGNDADSMSFGSVLCRYEQQRWSAVPEPLQWYWHGQTICKDGVAQFTADFVQPGTTSVTFSDGSIGRPIAGRLFRVHWYLCRSHLRGPAWPRVESLQIDGCDLPPLVATYPVSADYLLDQLVGFDSQGLPEDSDRYSWIQDVRLEAASADVLRAGLDRLRREDDAELRLQIALGPVQDAVLLEGAYAHEVLLTAATQSERVRTTLRSIDLPDLGTQSSRDLAALLAEGE